jgi:hypothetical protein
VDLKIDNNKTCSRAIGVYVQMLSVILGSRLDIIGETYMIMYNEIEHFTFM